MATGIAYVLKRRLPEARKIAELYENIALYRFTFVGLLKSDEDTKITGEGVLAVNTEMDVRWQVECHVIEKHKLKKVALNRLEEFTPA